MKKEKTLLLRLCSLIVAFALSSSVHADETARQRLGEQYRLHCERPSDINEHLPHLKKIAVECSSVVELGVRSMVSTWALLEGLTENPSPERRYLGVDLDLPPSSTYRLAQELCEKNGISFDFAVANDLHIDIAPTDLLFIDTLHTYAHLTYELERFSTKTRKFIAMHDTSPPFGTADELSRGDFSEYPPNISRTKRGLWQAVVDFLDRHPEWQLMERHHNNHGFTILRRVSLPENAF